MLVYWFLHHEPRSQGIDLSARCRGGYIAGSISQVVGAIVIDGPEKVEAEVLLQSTWNL